MESFSPGKLITFRGRDWVVLPSDDEDLLVVKPLGGTDHEVAGVYLPLEIEHDRPRDARFEKPTADDLSDFSTARMLYDSARLAFRNGAGPFRALAKISFRPRSYQLVPLVMALRQATVRLLVADDVGVGKTVEALLLTRELMERRKITRFAVVCLPHLCEQWQEEIRNKLDLDAVIIRSSTQARLDRQIQGDTSVYEYYPYQIISIDYIKGESRRDVFIEQCPELIIVDEAHTCARPAGASTSQQLRFNLLNRLAAKPDQHLVMLTATPHSGKQEEFNSLLGLLSSEFETLDLPNSTQNERRELAKYFVQRKRSDVEKWLNEDTPFPKREPIDRGYALSREYATLFDDLLEFACKLLAIDPKNPKIPRRASYWAALALLRGVISSPAAGTAMLAARRKKMQEGETQKLLGEEVEENPVGDGDERGAVDSAPTSLFKVIDWSDGQLRQLNILADRLEALKGIEHDAKLKKLAEIIEDWISDGFSTVIFCRFIETAKYVGESLKTLLEKKFPKVEVQIVTSEEPDEVRRDRIAAMSIHKQRVLVATDCLSEGINLQELFTGVLHYDLPWNPNRLEQREGRVDRYGQTAKVVRTALLHGNNPIDGIVLNVILRKVRQIKKETGINVPFPEDSQSIIDTIAQALLLNPLRRVLSREENNQLVFDFGELPEAQKAQGDVAGILERDLEREKVSRSIFAQNAIKPAEIEQDLQAVDEAIGDPKAVEDFVVAALRNLFGVQVDKDRTEDGFHIHTGNFPPHLQGLLPQESVIAASFISPTPKGFYYIGRNHRFVEQLCQVVMANTIARKKNRAARAAVIRTDSVKIKTTLLLFRCRNVIEQSRKGAKSAHQIIAEEMLLWGWRGTPSKKEFLTHEEAKALMGTARAASNMTPESRASFLDNELSLLTNLEEDFSLIAEEQSKRLVAAHERFSALVEKNRFQVVYPVLPMDLLGIYILLPSEVA